MSLYLCPLYYIINNNIVIIYYILSNIYYLYYTNKMLYNRKYTLSVFKHGLTYSTPIDVTKEDTYATNGILAIVPDSSIVVSLTKSGI